MATPGALLCVDLIVPVWGLLRRPEHTLAIVLAAVAMVGYLRWMGLYRRRFTEKVLDDFPHIVIGGLVAWATVTTLGFASTQSGWTLLALVAGMTVGRGLLYWARGAVSPDDRFRIVLWGAGETAERTAHALAHSGDRRFRLVDHMGGDASTKPGSDEPTGQGEELGRTVRGSRANVVLLADPPSSSTQVATAVRHHIPQAVEVFSVAGNETQQFWRGPEIDRIEDVTVLRLRFHQGRPARLVKRAADIVLSLVALVVLAPLMAAAALALRVEVGPGVIFHQERVGEGGRTFTLLKFRTLRSTESGATSQWSIAGDDRLGPVGRFLRVSSIDELPQLVNILRGDMSLVGPRPERPEFSAAFSMSTPLYADRLRMPAGLTGHSAVHGLRGDTSISERSRFDNVYIDNWSLWEDVKVVLRTTVSIFTRPGA